MPLLKQGAKAVGRQALETGIQVAGDMLEIVLLRNLFEQEYVKQGSL